MLLMLLLLTMMMVMLMMMMVMLLLHCLLVLCQLQERCSSKVSFLCAVLQSQQIEGVCLSLILPSVLIETRSPAS